MPAQTQPWSSLPVRLEMMLECHHNSRHRFLNASWTVCSQLVQVMSGCQHSYTTQWRTLPCWRCYAPSLQHKYDP